MKLLRYVLLGCALPFSAQAEMYDTAPWSHVYKKIYNDHECKKNKSATTVTFQESKTVPFTQLIFCWNAHRPVDGAFAFSVRVHTKGGRWGVWHKMALWGDTVQKSFFNRGPEAVFNYVRLEMNTALLQEEHADGFELRVEKVGKASLEGLKGLFVCVSDMKVFMPERPYSASKGLPSVYVNQVPKKSQKLIDHPRIGALCSPTTLSMVLEYLTGNSIDALETARNVYDEGLDAFGSWPFNMAYAFEKTKGAYFLYVERLSSFAQLHALLSYMPVGLSVRGAIKGAHKPYPSGHFLVVVGYDAQKKQVLCFDPAFETLDKVEVAYDIAEFLPAWERSNRLIYSVQPAS